MLTTEENDLLCRVEDEAPMGALMRRHWTPSAGVRSTSAGSPPPITSASGAARRRLRLPMGAFRRS